MRSFGEAEVAVHQTRQTSENEEGNGTHLQCTNVQQADREDYSRDWLSSAESDSV